MNFFYLFFAFFLFRIVCETGCGSRDIKKVENFKTLRKMKFLHFIKYMTFTFYLFNFLTLRIRLIDLSYFRFLLSFSMYNRYYEHCIRYAMLFTGMSRAVYKDE